MREYIERRFGGWSAGEYRERAHKALNDLIAGDVLAADENIRKLDPYGAADFRRKLGELDLVPRM